MDMNTLEKLHKAELYLLLSFDKVCRENGLTYFLDSGTALGAVRHSGFIPWDDDIDVGMPRSDYEKFLKIGQKFFPEDIFIQTRETEQYYKRNAAKLRLVGTIFPEESSVKFKHKGIFIDIFPFDNLPSNYMLAKWNIKFIVFVYHMVRSYNNKEKSPFLISRIFQQFLKMLPYSWILKLEKFYLSYSRHYENSDTKYMTSYFWRMTLSKEYVFDKSKMLPTRDILFEGHPVRIVNSPDYYLSMMYGDYMKLPPEEKRVTHFCGDIIFQD